MCTKVEQLFSSMCSSVGVRNGDWGKKCYLCRLYSVSILLVKLTNYGGATL